MLDVGLVVDPDDESVVDCSVDFSVDCSLDCSVDCSVFDGGTVACDGDLVVTVPVGDGGSGVGVGVELGVGVEGFGTAAPVVTGAAAWACETVFMARLASYDHTIPTGQTTASVPALSFASSG